MQLEHNSQHETALIAHGTIEWASLFHVVCLCSTTAPSSASTAPSSPHSTGCLAFTLLSVPSQYTGSQHPVTHTKHPARKWGPGKQILRGEERRRAEREAFSWWVWCQAEVLGALASRPALLTSPTLQTDLRPTFPRIFTANFVFTTDLMIWQVLSTMVHDAQSPM